ncbi:unnamed protein product [Prunus armeniaca]
MSGDKKAVRESSQTKKPQAASMKLEVKTFTRKENFKLLQRSMNHAIAQQGLTIILVGEAKRPEIMTMKKGDMPDELAMGSIKVMDDTVKHTLEKLKRMLVARSLSNKCFMKEELLNIRMEEGGNHMENLSTFNRCIVDLQKVDVVYSTEDAALMLLASLPLSY